MPSTANAASAGSGTSVSPVDQLLNGNRPARYPNPRRSAWGLEKRIRIMVLFYAPRGNKLLFRASCLGLDGGFAIEGFDFAEDFGGGVDVEAAAAVGDVAAQGAAVDDL